MKVLLTGASGFVGSHILECLRSQQIPTAILLRRTSNPRLIADHLPHVKVHYGSLSEPDTVATALRGATHVIHCAGCTKALRGDEFYEANQLGTRRVVDAIDEQGGAVQRLVHISSLAAAGPAPADRPAREEDPPQPVSEYGRSKLAGEREITERCRANFVILRPPAVYGPGDADFLALFKALRMHLLPSFGGGRQAISLIFAKDLARAAVLCLTHAAAIARIFNVASQEEVVVRDFALAIAAQMRVRPVPLTFPGAFLWPVCLAGEAVSRLTGKPGLFNRLRYPELCARGWVCDTRRIREELGWANATPLSAGIAETLTWYRSHGWLP